MAADDLNAPLGQDKPIQKTRKIPVGTPQLLAGLLGLFGLVTAGWILFGNDPLGGEPVAVVVTKPPAPAAAKAADGGDGKNHRRHDGEDRAVADAGEPQAKPAEKAAEKPAIPPGARTVTIIDGSSGQRQDVVIPGSEAKPGFDKALLDMTPYGPIPKIGADGKRAFSVYAHPRKVPANRSGAPHIAIVLGGLGISAIGTEDALAKLPAPVSFALAPYNADVEVLAKRARAQGHELLLQVPMEPFDYPNNDPGPRTLLLGQDQVQTIDRLHWLMARFQGYVGLINFMGGKFTGSEQTLTPVLRETAKRGLIYVDDGSSLRSVAAQVAGSLNVPFARADITMDALPTALDIDRALARLEVIARDRGVAVGYATAQPAVVARIAEWASKVEDKGFILVPITMVAVKAKSS